MDLIQFMGYLAGFILAIALVPQVWKSWKTKSTKDVSLLWSLVYTFGLALFLIYGIGIKQMPVIVMNTAEILLALSLVTAKLIYK
ncbi:MAG: SemiSWEET family transporter [Patescibacteria group bacterium]|nr:SemiSWEET family transporter [Patescibacteria group bacterium]